MQLKAELVSAWLLKASHDLGTAQALLKHCPDYEDTIAFHCQQCVEKVLKACLVWLDIYPPKTHDLWKLSKMLNDSAAWLSDYEEDLRDLSYFAVIIRYPEAELPTQIPILHLISVAERISNMIKQLLAEKGYESPASS